MKKIILSVAVVASFLNANAQEIKTDVKAIQTAATTEAKTQGSSAIQSTLTQLIGGINPTALTSGNTAAGLLTKLSTATSTGGSYGPVLGLLANSLSTTSFGPGWAKLKAGYADKAGKAKTAVEVAGLASQLVNNLKPNAFTSSFNKAGLLSTLAKIK